VKAGMIDPGARQSVTELSERLRPFIARRLPSAADVDDVLQDVFVRMQCHLSELRDRDRFGPWLYRIVRNVIADRFRRRATEAAVPDELPQDERSADEDPSTELATCVAPLVARLPSPYREAVTLVDLEGLSHKEAAKRSGLSVPGMKSRVQRGRAQLRSLFEDCCRLEFDARQRVVEYACRSDKGPKGGCRT
jgi:RNA polymerase sigma-70 factor, ECF subfamily